MKKEWLLLAGSVTVSLLLALVMIRWLAPELIGGPVAIDRRVVQVDEKVVPYFEHAFSIGDGTTNMVNDPYTGHRRVGMVHENSTGRTNGNAPFDMLGFRNRSVPAYADVITIGDSQAVGPGVIIDFNWPSKLQHLLADKHASVYNMSAGGWGAVQYLYMFDKALLFKPRVVVVAFYTGNDPVDTLHMAYQFEPWHDLRGFDPQPKSPPSGWPPRKEDMWRVRFADGITTEFTAKSRLMSNHRDYPAVPEAYRIIAEVGRRIADKAAKAGVRVVFTVIPTKELVYARKVEREHIAPPDDYATLVKHERQNIAELAKVLSHLPSSAYVDLATPLQELAIKPLPLYPPHQDGHPAPIGHQAIARILAKEVGRGIPSILADGLYVLPGAEEKGKYLLVRDGVWRFETPEIAAANGWPANEGGVPEVSGRDLAGLKNRGWIFDVRPDEYGPRRE